MIAINIPTPNHSLVRTQKAAPHSSTVRGTPPARRERGELLRQRLFFRPQEVAFRTIAGALSRLRMACEHAILGGTRSARPVG